MSAMKGPIRADGVTLRPTREADLAQARALFTDPGFYEHWDGKPKSDEEIAEKYLGRRSPAVECFFVEVDRKVIGFVQWHVADDGGEGGGMDLALIPSARGRGIGAAVAAAVVKHVTTVLGWCRFTVDPDVGNEGGVAFWKAIGFVPTGVISDDERGPYWLMEWPTS